MVLEIFSFFFPLKVRAFQIGENERKEEGRREEEENQGLEFMFGTLHWNISFVWNISFDMECMDLLVRKLP